MRGVYGIECTVHVKRVQRLVSAEKNLVAILSKGNWHDRNLIRTSLRSCPRMDIEKKVSLFSCLYFGLRPRRSHNAEHCLSPLYIRGYCMPDFHFVAAANQKKPVKIGGWGDSGEDEPSCEIDQLLHTFCGTRD